MSVSSSVEELYEDHLVKEKESTNGHQAADDKDQTRNATTTTLKVSLFMGLFV